MFVLQELIERHVDEHDRPEEWCYKADSYPEYTRKIWRTVLEVHDEADRCAREGQQEVEWNTEVHRPLLKRVVEHSKYEGAMGYANV